VALAACAESAVAPMTETPAFAATTETINMVEPLDLVVFVDCAANGAGEDVMLTGRLHVLLHTTMSNSGILHVRSHFQPQALAGVGAATGDRYRGVGVTQDNLTVHPNGFPATFSFINNFRMIGQGKGNNFHVHENTHITVNANGDVVVDRTNLRVTCN
jgi:hypothetical protein